MSVEMFLIHSQEMSLKNVLVLLVLRPDETTNLLLDFAHELLLPVLAQQS